MLRSRYCYSHLPYHLLRGVRSVPSSWYLLMQQVLLLSLCTCSPSYVLLLLLSTGHHAAGIYCA